MTHQKVRGTRIIALIAIVGILGAACSGSAANEATQATSTTIVATTSGPSVSQVEPTTTAPATTSTTTPSGQSVQLETKEGWQYELTVTALGADPSASEPSECVSTALPGFTNYRVRIDIRNLINDREAPAPSIGFDSNLDEDGLPMVEKTETFQDVEVDGRVAADNWGTVSPTTYVGSCYVEGSSLSSADFDLPAGGTESFEVVIGPIQEGATDGLRLFFRMFNTPDAYSVNYSFDLT